MFGPVAEFDVLLRLEKKSAPPPKIATQAMAPTTAPPMTPAETPLLEDGSPIAESDVLAACCGVETSVAADSCAGGDVESPEPEPVADSDAEGTDED